MAKIPVKLVVDTAKQHGPKIFKIVKENKDVLPVIMPIFDAGTKKAAEFLEKRKDKQTENDKDHYRKRRFKEYKTKDLSNLNMQSRIQLIHFKHEIESFIQQISNEEKQELAAKKPVHAKRIKNWNSLLVQIEDQIAIKDYQEYFTMYNDPTYESTYFVGFERHIKKYKGIIAEDSFEDLVAFIHDHTKRDINTIKKEFI